MRGQRIVVLVAAAGLLLGGCGLGGDAQVVEAEAADQGAQSAGKAGQDKAQQDADAAAEKRAKQAEKRARRAEKRAEEAEAKAKAAQALEEDRHDDDEALAEHMAQNPEAQRLALDMGWETATQTERDDVCAGWVMGGEVRELIVEIMVQASEGIIERDVTEVYLEEKCS